MAWRRKRGFGRRSWYFGPYSPFPVGEIYAKGLSQFLPVPVPETTSAEAYEHYMLAYSVPPESVGTLISSRRESRPHSAESRAGA
jgi:hypothetical protein